MALRDGPNVNVIQGPPGTGKSWLARSLGGVWEEAGGRAIVGEGDLLHSQTALYPLGFALAELSSTWRVLGSSLSGVTRAGERAAGTFGAITSAVGLVSQLRRRRRRARRLYLGEPEQAILFELGRLARKQPLLLIADNLHWWDAASLEFLGRMLAAPMAASFPFLADLRVLAVQTPAPYQSVAHPIAHDALLAVGGARFFQVDRVPRRIFRDVLLGLGAPDDVPRDVVDGVYALSGGHLALAHQCASRMAGGDNDAFTGVADADEFLRRLLADRLRALGDLGQRAVTVLEIASVLGLTFRRDEVACASGVAEADLATVLRYCRDETLVELTNGLGRFVHDLYRQHFLESGALDRTSVHGRLVDCLRLLRPADYEGRCLNALAAEQMPLAATLAVHAALQRERDGRAWAELPVPVRDAAVGMRAVIETFTAALDHLAHYRFDACAATLDALPHDIATSLAAEADHIRAMNLLSTRSEEDRAAARSLLDTWLGYEETEPELGIRLLHLLLYGRSHLVNKELGRQLEGRLRRTLIQRVSFDTAAEDALYVLDRASGSLYQPEIALARIREAAEHFGPAGDELNLRRPVEYYRCLVNLVAHLISNAQYAEAVNMHRRVEALIDGFTQGVFPRPDHARMNGLLAEYRAGRVDAREAARRQRTVGNGSPVSTDTFYLRNALAVYLALTGELAGAAEIWDAAYAELVRTRADPEPSMVYLLRANRCAARHLAGEDDPAEWLRLGAVVARIPYAIRPLLVRRHELLGPKLAQAGRMAPSEFDECLISEALEFGPLWDNFGRGFRMPEVEFWREN